MKTILLKEQMKFIDLTHEIGTDVPMSLFNSSFSPIIYPAISHIESSKMLKEGSYEVTKLEFVGSIGTYLDSPYHYDPNGVDISGLTLDDCILQGKLVDLSQKKPRSDITDRDLSKTEIKRGDAVLLYTGWDKYWATEDYLEHPFLTRKGAEFLFQKKIGLVGIDTLIIDDPKDKSRPVHNLLLKNKILITENLTNLNMLKNKKFIFVVTPPKIKKVASFPVRAFAII